MMPNIKLKVKISIADEKNRGFFGIGIVWLLEEIEKTGSIRKAAQNMKMSYSKAHKILKRAEEKFGKKFLIKKRGGIERGGAELTDFAKEFISSYKNFQQNIKDFAKEQFENEILKILTQQEKN